MGHYLVLKRAQKEEQHDTDGKAAIDRIRNINARLWPQH
jgi:hypothetical protein